MYLPLSQRTSGSTCRWAHPSPPGSFRFNLTPGEEPYSFPLYHSSIFCSPSLNRENKKIKKSMALSFVGYPGCWREPVLELSDSLAPTDYCISKPGDDGFFLRHPLTDGPRCPPGWALAPPHLPSPFVSFLHCISLTFSNPAPRIERLAQGLFLLCVSNSTPAES